MRKWCLVRISEQASELHVVVRGFSVRLCRHPGKVGLVLSTVEFLRACMKSVCLRLSDVSRGQYACVDSLSPCLLLCSMHKWIHSTILFVLRCRRAALSFSSASPTINAKQILYSFGAIYKKDLYPASRCLAIAMLSLE